jgi:flavin-dependent dehydrogenase
VARLDGDLQRGFVAELHGRHAGWVQARVVVGAFGKQRATFQDRAAATHRGWVALKSHVHGLEPAPAGVELHAFRGGYVGLAPVGRGRVNVCLVVTPAALRAAIGGGAAGALQEIVRAIPALEPRWCTARLDPESTCSESGTEFGAVHPTWRDVLLAGDAAALPHPLAGDGIAMALRAGNLAARCAQRFLDGELSAAQVPGEYARAWRHEFQARLRWSGLLHAALVRPRVMRPLLSVLASHPPALHYLVQRTRGAAAVVAAASQDVVR